MIDSGKKMYELVKELFYIPRSITGNGVRKSLNIINNRIKKYDLEIHEVPSGKKVFDWTVPKEWNVNDAYILAPNGEKIIDFKLNSLHLVGYSSPVDSVIKKDELLKHIYTLHEYPEAIPYVTSYYKEDWGFCMSEMQKSQLIDGDYKVYIDSKLSVGSLTYADLVIPGETDKEIFLSTYICHPQMANNELSGPALMTELINFISEIKNRKYTYRFVYIPETIGSIVYLDKNHELLKKKVIAGFNLTCVGDNYMYSFLPSRMENSYSDQVSRHVLKSMNIDYKEYSFLERGSDERQYCSPGINLPISSIMRSKYGEYKEYHTSFDNLDFVSAEGLYGSFSVYEKLIYVLENNNIYQLNTYCEPQLGIRGLYPNTSIKGSAKTVRDMMNVLAYLDGNNDLLWISEKVNLSFWDTYNIIQKILTKDPKLIIKKV